MTADDSPISPVPPRDLAIRALIVAILLAVNVLPFFSVAYHADEIWSLRAISLPLPEMVTRLTGDIHPPLYYFVLRAWSALAGQSETGTRALSLLLHFLAAMAVSTLFTDRRKALLVAAILVTSPVGVMASCLTRMYALLEFSAAISLVAWLQFMRTQAPSRKWLGIFIAANIAGTFTHIWFFFFLAGLAVAHLVFHRLARLGWMAAAAALSLLPFCVLWLPVLMDQMSHADQNLAWISAPGYRDLISASLMQGGMAWLVVLVAIVAQLFRRRVPQVGPTALLWVATLLTPVLISFHTPVFGTRFSVVAAPAFAIAAATLISAAGRPILALSAQALLSFVLTGALLWGYVERCESRWTARWLAEHTRPGDVVLFTDLSRSAVDYYWDQIQPNRKVVEQSLPGTTDQHPGFEGRADMNALLAETRELAFKLSNEPVRRKVFLLEGSDPPVHAMLVRIVDNYFRYLPEQCVMCGNTKAPNYYHRISVWESR